MINIQTQNIDHMSRSIWTNTMSTVERVFLQFKRLFSTLKKL